MTTTIAEYSPTEAKLAELRQQYGATVWIIGDPKQMADAKKARSEIRKWRTDLETERKRIKEPALTRCKEIDAEAKRITCELLKLEEPVDHAIKEVEAKQEAERQAKAQAENLRIEKARYEVESIRDPAIRLVGAPSSEIEREIAELKEEDVSRQDEFAPLAEVAKSETLTKLTELLRASMDREDEQARIAAERAELAKLRAEQEERNRVDQEKAAKETAARVKAESEARAKMEDEERASRERIAKEESEARHLRAKADEEARQERLKEQARLEVERQKIEAEKKKADDARRKSDEAKAKKEREKQKIAQLRMDGRELLKTFVDKHGKAPEFARVTKAIADYFAETKQA